MENVIIIIVLDDVKILLFARGHMETKTNQYIRWERWMEYIIAWLAKLFLLWFTPMDVWCSEVAVYVWCTGDET